MKVRICPYKNDTNHKDCVAYKETKVNLEIYYDKILPVTQQNNNYITNSGSAISYGTTSTMYIGASSAPTINFAIPIVQENKAYHICKKKVKVSSYCALVPGSNLGIKTKIVDTDEVYVVYGTQTMVNNIKLLEWKESLLKDKEVDED